jgi:hypothetical protein
MPRLSATSLTVIATGMIGRRWRGMIELRILGDFARVTPWPRGTTWCTRKSESNGRKYQPGTSFPKL